MTRDWMGLSNEPGERYAEGMMRAAAVAALAVLCAGAGDLPLDVLQLARLKLKMRQALNTLPDYTCLAVTERSRQALVETAPRREDSVRLEVAHSEGHDLYAWPGADRFETSNPSDLVGNGMFASGEFATHLMSVFGGTAVIRYQGAESLWGKKLLRWSYTLAPSLGTEWRVVFGGRMAIAGAKGSFWADAETLDVVRIEAETDGLPPNFPISSVVTTIRYARVVLGERDVLLPESASTILTDFRSERCFNFTEFSHCRQYQTRSAIRYGVDTTAPEPPGAPVGLREIVLPAGLRITVELSGDIDPARAAVGDAIAAVVTSDVLQKKRVSVPKGAVLRGRLRRMELDDNAYVLGLELTDIEYSGNHARFLARLERAEGRKVRYGKVPGVGMFVMETQYSRLPRGTLMVWVTEDVSKR